MPAADPSQPSTPDSSTVGTPVVTSRRISALDGLRGLAVVLVALGHAGGQLWPPQPLDSVPVRFYLRRLVRLGVQLVPLVLVIVLITTWTRWIPGRIAAPTRPRHTP